MVNYSTISSDDELKLFCCVLDGHNRAFSVTICGTQTVDRLKKAIKKEIEPNLDHLAYHSINIWKVSMCLLACANGVI